MMLVLIAVAVALVIGTSYVSSAIIKTAGSRNLLKASRARYLAESGMQHAIYMMWNDPSSLDGTSSNNPRGPFAADNTADRYSFWATPDGVDIGLYHVTARATADGMSQDARWSIYRTPAYDMVVLSKSPEAYWRFGEPHSTWLAHDSAGAGYDMVGFGGVDMGEQGALVNGSNTAVVLDGYNEYFYRPPTGALQMRTDLTISMWFKMDHLPYGSDKAFLVTCSEEGEEQDRNALYQLTINSQGKLEYLHEFHSGYDQSTVFQNASFSAGTWHNLVVTRDWANSTIKVYLQGQLVDTWTFTNPGTPPPASGGQSGLYVGSAWGDEDFFDGTIDELALLDRPLTAQEVATIHSVGGTPAVVQVRSSDD